MLPVSFSLVKKSSPSKRDGDGVAWNSNNK
jgi:hypothetical protein